MEDFNDVLDHRVLCKAEADQPGWVPGAPTPLEAGLLAQMGHLTGSSEGGEVCVPESRPSRDNENAL